MFDRFRRLLPAPEVLLRNRWLRWLGPALHHPRLWHISRRGIALGMAIGVFFGLLIPIAQIPLSAAAAVALRANVPVAVTSTLVSNPFTFPPIYYAAWRLGKAMLGEPLREDELPPWPPQFLDLPGDELGGVAAPGKDGAAESGTTPGAQPETPPDAETGMAGRGVVQSAQREPEREPERVGWLASIARQVGSVGKPLMVGLITMAVVASVLTYLLVLGLWYLKVSWTWRRRRGRLPRSIGG